MLIYFDESYDRRHRYLLLGALFLPSSRLPHQHMSSIKQAAKVNAPNHTFVDMKYSKSSDRYICDACYKVVDLFERGRAYFRAIVIDTNMPKFSWDHFGTPAIAPQLKRAYAYNKYSELLLTFNLQSVQNAVLLADSLTRTPGDNFIDFMLNVFGPSLNLTTGFYEPAKIKHIQPINTALEQYQLGQMCDILLGVICGELVPPRNYHKLSLIKYVKAKLGIPSLLPSYWNRYPKYRLNVMHPKYQIWYWKPS